jgi:ubiquinone/menaquinone biosynthesis C-methylase UbiE
LTDGPPAYIHGTDADEQRRLSLLNDLLNEASLARLTLAPGDHVLDVGSGLGQLSRAIARRVGRGGRVLGVERSEEQRRTAERLAAEAGEAGLVEFRAGDAAGLPLTDREHGRFDLAHTRFVLEHVTDPLKVVREMVRAVRPGGRVVLMDDDHDVLRLHPEPAGFGPLWHAYVRSYDRLGCDPYVGRRLVALLHAAGARPTAATGIFYGGAAGTPAFEAAARNLVRIMVGARDALTAPGMLAGDAFDGAVRALEAWSSRPDAACWFSLCWAEGVREGPPLPV